ncbi:methyltransferase [Thalassobaculum sp.]|uniref:tRNA1(Val) (adenine(37)-N6)-methyltransferase n=1 Tax=Thalassobaculum sp. TaxID=2022740 RepID=UPI0032ECBB4E
MSGSTTTDGAVSEDALLGGRLRLRQPRDGYRAAIDPVLLAAAVPLRAGERVLDLGCGAGAVFLCLLAREPALTVTAVERDPAMAALARSNASLNGFGERVEVAEVDVATLLPDWRAGDFDQVLSNPPYLPAERADPSPHAGRAAAGVEAGSDLVAWVGRARRCLRHKGRLTMVHRADRLGDLLAALDGFGEIVVFPLWPRAGQEAKRVIVTARNGVRSPLRLAAGLVLHDAGGGYTKAADAALRGAGLDLGP